MNQIKKTIAILDDDETFHKFICHILSDDYIVWSVHTVSEFRRLINAIDLDGVLIDIFVGKENGVTQIRELRKIYPDLKIIGMSGVGEENFIKGVIDSGANAFIHKMDFKSIKNTVKNIIN